MFVFQKYTHTFSVSHSFTHTHTHYICMHTYTHICKYIYTFLLLFVLSRLAHFEYVKSEDLEKIGMGKPAVRRLLDAIKRKRTLRKKGGIFEKVILFVFVYYCFLLNSIDFPIHSEFKSPSSTLCKASSVNSWLWT